MCKKLMFLISLVLLLGLVSSVSAADKTWTNSYPWSMLWLSAANWDPAEVPGSGDTAIVSPQYVDPLALVVYPAQGPVIDCNLVVGQIRGPRHDSGDDQIMLVLAGDVVVNGEWRVGESGAGTATLEISGGNVHTGELRGMTDGVGIVDIKGDAEVSIDRFKNLGENDAVTATINVSEDATLISRSSPDDSFRDEVEYFINVSGDASLIAESEFKVGDDDSVGSLHVTDDAYMYIDNEWEMANNDDAYMALTVDGNGVIEADNRLRLNGNGDILFTDDAIVDISDYLKMADEGEDCFVTLTIGGNASVSVGDNVWFGDDGTGEIIMTGGSFSCDDLRVPDSGLAASMSVTDAEINCSDLAVPEDGSCDFTIAGTSLITCGDFKVGRAPGGTLAAMDGGRVDCEAFEHTTNYFMDFTLGELLIDGNDQPLYQDIYDEILAGRISGYGGCGGQGKMHIDQYSIADHTLVYASFNPYRAWNPSPTCNAVDQPPIVDLSWNAGLDADIHHGFLSPNFDLVNDGNLAVWEFAQADPDTDYTTGMLTLGQTYYWRIEEVDIGLPRVTEGQAWQFTVQESMPVDGGDMEDFDEGNPIWETWKDGCGDANGQNSNGTGSCLYTIAQSDQAMLYYYDNTGQDYHNYTRDCNYSEAINEFDAPQDWTLYGIEAIELMFKGEPNNDATALEAMYMVLTDDNGGEGVVVYGDKEPEVLEDMQVAEWQQWDIDLADFGIDPTIVTSIAIGFGDRTNCHREPGGVGVMLIDDIGLFPERCVPKYVVDIHDLNDDCVTDMKDVGEMSGEDHYLTDER